MVIELVRIVCVVIYFLCVVIVLFWWLSKLIIVVCLCCVGVNLFKYDLFGWCFKLFDGLIICFGLM